MLTETNIEGILSCTAAADVCACKAIVARVSRRATHIVGIPPLSGLALILGVLSMITTTTWRFGFAAIVFGAIAAVITRWLASDFKAAEASFRSMKGDFEYLLNCAIVLEESVVEVRTSLQGMPTLVNDITDYIKHNGCIALRDALTHLKEKSDATHVLTIQCRDSVNDKKQELRAVCT